MRVHLYAARLDALDQPRTRERTDALLSPDERSRRDRFVFARNRDEYHHAHALVRLALSRHAPAVAGAAWRFSEGTHGRPAIADPPCDLDFNLTHTDGLVACVVAPRAAGDIGVDAEHLDRRTRARDVAHRYFARPEVAALFALPDARQHERFFVYWTLKEAYIKARGVGIALGLARFWLTVDERDPLDAEHPPRIGFAPDLVDDPARWRFHLTRIAPRHLVAVAIGASDGGEAAELVIEDGEALLRSV